ncbi:hypothetical protein CC80DRAFT_531239 [Byssothecium circinans]|uniref:Uncharacterized protein n=1 Tax=Byssothecium circinans TaxID=147558 RepID=A0A6A5UML1_9PLEO|nr:hypothetical protein CC80DRAFT_531239 [Byssothecium circinans]
MPSRYENLVSKEPRPAFSTDWIWPCAGIVVTTAIGIAVTVLNAREWRSSEETALFVLEQRPTIAIAVQILSHILGWIQVQTLCGVIMSSFRVLLHHRAFRLDTIRFVDAVSRPNIAWKTRWPLRLGSLLFVLLSLVPGALWSGALTPLFAEKEVIRTLHIPTFESGNVSTIFDSSRALADSTGGFGSPVWMNNNGLFTFDLAISSIRGPFLGFASSASNTSQPGGFSAKFDQTGYRFSQRSYGAGSSAGLITIPDSTSPQWYSYKETGFLATASCKRDDESQINIMYLRGSNETEFFNHFQANGTFPSGDMVQRRYPQVSPQRQDIFIWATRYVPKEKRTYISMTVDSNLTDVDDWDFHQFYKVVCAIDYEPRRFTVKVNETNKVVWTSTTDADAVPWPDYGERVLSTFDLPFSRYSSDESMIFGSQLGHNLVININTLRRIKGNNDTETTYKALEDFVENLFDNGLGMLSATRLVALNETIPVEATVGLVAVRYGQSVFVYMILVVNVVIVLIFAVEAVRTRAWAGKAELVLQDVGSVLLSASAGGAALAEKARGLPVEEMGKLHIRLSTSTFPDREALVLTEKGALSLSRGNTEYENIHMAPRKSTDEL